MTLPCRDCRSWEGCPGTDWYAPGEVSSQYCRNHVRWVITQFLESSAGSISMVRFTWPHEDKETGYTDIPGKLSYHAPYELVIQVVGELIVRINETGQAGRFLVLEVLASDLYLCQEARDALSYCVGRGRKKMGFQAWLRQRELRDIQRGIAAQLYNKCILKIKK